MAKESMTNITSKIAVGGITIEPTQGSRGKVDKVVSKLRNLVQTIRRDLNIHVDDVTGHVVIRVVEEPTNKEVRQISDEEVLSMVRRLDDMLDYMPKGVLIQSEA